MPDERAIILHGQAVPDPAIHGVWRSLSGSGQFPPGFSPPRSAIHKLITFLMWLTLVSSAVVFTEPAPVDVLMAGMIALLPLTGLVHITRPLLAFLCLWLIIAMGSYIAAMGSFELSAATAHSSISLYLYLCAFIVAVFVAKRPGAHSRLILNGYLWAALLGASTGLIGYFDIIPGSHELFTKYGRAAGTFKDPNVLGPFLIPALLYGMHLTLNKRTLSAFVALAVTGVLALALLLSFSRGAWAAVVLASSLWAYLTFVTARTISMRLKLILIASTALLLAAGLFLLALQSDAVTDLFNERASLNQPYDTGPDGRFGGHEKALEQIISHPLGIGAATFSKTVHNENVHNVYLAMFLNAGWIGGFAYLLIIILTVIYGLRHGLRPTQNQPLFIVVYAAFISNALQGLVIDTDHWRHFYLLLGLVWGLMCVDRSSPNPLTNAIGANGVWGRCANNSRAAQARRSATLKPCAAPRATFCVPFGAQRRSCTTGSISRSQPPRRRRHCLNYRLAKYKVCCR